MVQFSNPDLKRQSAESFHPSLTVQKFFEYIDLAGKLASRLQNLGSSGVLTPIRNFVSLRPPKGTSLQQSALFEPLCVHIGKVIWAVEAYEKKVY
jgi:hypothetical protein